MEALDEGFFFYKSCFQMQPSEHCIFQYSKTELIRFYTSSSISALCFRQKHIKYWYVLNGKFYFTGSGVNEWYDHPDQNWVIIPRTRNFQPFFGPFSISQDARFSDEKTVFVLSFLVLFFSCFCFVFTLFLFCFVLFLCFDSFQDWETCIVTGKNIKPAYIKKNSPPGLIQWF